MALFLPVTLVGDNLGQRHRHLNSLVREAKESEALFQDVEALSEESAVDRLFKIDLARELKHVDYIIRNLKDDDMLYVSRALKATWLIDHRDIINPKYLEDVLFPEMITPAVTKMKHWLYINLRDPAMCQTFYQHYKENTFEFAIKFLSHCSHEFILEEASKIVTKLSTHLLKVLCEKCPKVAKIYFDSIATDENVKARYLEREQSYYNSVKCVLKSDADVFLNITEKYFNMNSFGRLSPLGTDYILRFHKSRITNKLELYVAYFLHIPTLAARLSVDECQEVVVKLARASYLRHWFEYKVVEPLIKRLSPDKRAAFKKRVFADKDVGDCVDKWSYDIPASPMHSHTGPHIFDDQDFMSGISPIYHPRASGDCVLFGASATLCAAQPQSFNNLNIELRRIRVKTDLDRLFDEFRFIGFERALHELGQRLVATASPDRRRDIFIVLVSKTGGRTDAVSALLRLARKHSNEPPHTRAAIVRSLVKRANVWRLPHDIWQHLLDYGHGLGLDGKRAEAECREGLHAVVIRQLLAGECEQAVRDAFMNDFSTLVEYSLKSNERARVADGLQNMLAAAATDVASEVAANRLRQLLDVLKIYRVRVEPTSPAVKAVMALALRNADVARPLLERLYNEKIARRELLRLNMEFRRDEAALLNALRHDPSLLDATRVVDTTPSWNSWHRNLRCIKTRPIVFRNVAVLPQNFDTSAITTTGFRFDYSAAPVPGFRFGSSTSPPTDVSSSAAPPTGFRFDSSAVPPSNLPFGSSTAQPFARGSFATAPTDVGSFTVPTRDIGFPHSSPTGYKFGSTATQPTDASTSSTPPTGFRFGSSATTLKDVGSSTVPTTDVGFSRSSPTGCNVGSVATQPSDASTSFTPPTDFRFGSSPTDPRDVGSSTVPTTDVGFSHSSSTGYNFGSAATQRTDASTSSTPPTGFRFGSSATTLKDVGSFNVPTTDVGFSRSSPTSFRFGNSATALRGDASFTVPTIDVSFSRPPTGLRFGNSATALRGDVSFTVPTTDVGFSRPSPTGLRFDSSATALTDDGNFTVPTTDIGFLRPSSTGVRFGSSATDLKAVGSSIVPTTDVGFAHSSPIGYNFGRTAVQPTDTSTSSTPPTGLRFGSSSTNLTDVGSSIMPRTGVGFSHSSTTGFRFRSSDTALIDVGSSTVLTTDVGNSTVPTTDVGFSHSFPTIFRFGSSTVEPTVHSNSAAQPMVFRTSTAHSAATGTISKQPTLFGTPTPRPMHSGMPASQIMDFGRNPYHPTRFRIVRQANVDSFISKLVIYFHQKEDFKTHLCTALKKKLAQGQNIKLARPLASLFGNHFEKELHAFDAVGKENMKFAAALRACAHRARPVVNLAEWGWHKAGVKAVATRAMRCREIERAALTRALAAERRTVRIALALSMRSTSELLLETFASTAKLRPAVALRIALLYFRRHGINSDLKLWDIVKPLISNVNLESRERLRHLLGNTTWIPSIIKADYCITLYRALYKFSFHHARMVLRDISKLLPECDECIETILLQILDDDTDKDMISIPYPTIFVRYLLLSKNEEDVEKRFMKIGNRFLERLDMLRSENDFYFQRRLSLILESLKYNAAFLDTKYTSCLSVIKRILAWTHKFMPTDKYFEKYMQIHLTMLYFKAVRQSMKQMPEVFADPKRRKSEGVETVGFVFGKYIMKEVAKLVSTYFDSITELYTDGLIQYLSCNFIYGSSRNIFIGFVLKGILAEANGIQRRVAVYVLREHRIVIEESVRQEIEDLITKDRDLQFFANTELLSHVVPAVPFYKHFRI